MLVAGRGVAEAVAGGDQRQQGIVDGDKCQDIERRAAFERFDGVPAHSSLAAGEGVVFNREGAERFGAEPEDAVQ